MSGPPCLNWFEERWLKTEAACESLWPGAWQGATAAGAGRRGGGGKMAGCVRVPVGLVEAGAGGLAAGVQQREAGAAVRRQRMALVLPRCQNPAHAVRATRKSGT